MTTSVTRPCFTTQHQTCKTKTKTDLFVLRPTVSDHITDIVSVCLCICVYLSVRLSVCVCVCSTKDSVGLSEPADLHPEKRVRAAYQNYEERRLPQLKAENPQLRLSQLRQMMKKDWNKSPENPLNQSLHHS